MSTDADCGNVVGSARKKVMIRPQLIRVYPNSLLEYVTGTREWEMTGRIPVSGVDDRFWDATFEASREYLIDCTRVVIDCKILHWDPVESISHWELVVTVTAKRPCFEPESEYQKWYRDQDVCDITHEVERMVSRVSHGTVELP